MSNTMKRKLLQISELDEIRIPHGNILGSRKWGKPLSFYRDNRFSQFDTRKTISDTDESHELMQLLRLL